MKLPRDISGADLIACSSTTATRVNQGSHVILQTEKPVHHRIADPTTTSYA